MKAFPAWVKILSLQRSVSTAACQHVFLPKAQLRFVNYQSSHMSLGLPRAVLTRRQAGLLSRRHQQVVLRRTASTTSPSQVANASKEKVAHAASKAQDGLTRAVSGAGTALVHAGRALSNVGGPVGRIVNRVQTLIPPTMYYSRVGLELGKIVFEARSMNLPPVQSFQNYFSSLFQNFRHPSQIASSFNTAISTLRSINSQQARTIGIVAAEVLGFFTIGEMIGRLKIVGYRSKEHALQHHDQE